MPFGYSYLFMQNNNLYHSFSFGPNFPMYCILDTISTNPFNPSIAYKSFNYGYIDFIWMEIADSGYNILYKRDAKYIWENVKPIKPDDEISVYGYPNPFSDIHYFTVETKIKTPKVSIYKTNGEEIIILDPTSIINNKYCYNWNGCNQSGKRASEGSYIIRCVAGNKIVARKIVLKN